jgi:hypothetical protein
VIAKVKSLPDDEVSELHTKIKDQAGKTEKIVKAEPEKPRQPEAKAADVKPQQQAQQPVKTERMVINLNPRNALKPVPHWNEKALVELAHDYRNELRDDLDSSGAPDDDVEAAKEAIDTKAMAAFARMLGHAHPNLTEHNALGIVRNTVNNWAVHEGGARIREIKGGDESAMQDFFNDLESGAVKHENNNKAASVETLRKISSAYPQVSGILSKMSSSDTSWHDPTRVAQGIGQYAGYAAGYKLANHYMPQRLRTPAAGVQTTRLGRAGRFLGRSAIRLGAAGVIGSAAGWAGQKIGNTISGHSGPAKEPRMTTGGVMGDLAGNIAGGEIGSMAGRAVGALAGAVGGPIGEVAGIGIGSYLGGEAGRAIGNYFDGYHPKHVSKVMNRYGAPK